jgi:hypothetical protein
MVPLAATPWHPPSTHRSRALPFSLPLPLPPPSTLRQAPPWPAMELEVRPWPPPMESSKQAHFSLWDDQKRCAQPLLLYPPSILSEMDSNLQILQDFVFQPNSDFISNSNFNPSRLLPRPNISLGAPPPCPSTQILPQNQTLAATLSSTTSPVPLIAATPVPNSSLQIKPRASRGKPRT